MKKFSKKVLEKIIKNIKKISIEKNKKYTGYKNW